MKKIVIIGGVAGGATAAARLRRLDEKAEIILMERGDYISYANCGLPYHIGDVIKSRDALLVSTPEMMKSRFNIDVRTGNEVTSIDRDAKSVHVKTKDGKEYDESYDTLVISTGSSPLKPKIPGIDSDLIQTLWTVPDTDRIRHIAIDSGIKSAAVIGGGFIGYLNGPLNLPLRIISFAGGLCMVIPGTITDIIGILAVAAVILKNHYSAS